MRITLEAVYDLNIESIPADRLAKLIADWEPMENSNETQPTIEWLLEEEAMSRVSDASLEQVTVTDVEWI